MLLFIGVLVLSFLAAFLIPGARRVAEGVDVLLRPALDHSRPLVLEECLLVIGPVRDWITVWLLLPMRDFYLWLPWTLVAGLLGLAGWWFGGGGSPCWLRCWWPPSS